MKKIVYLVLIALTLSNCDDKKKGDSKVETEKESVDKKENSATEKKEAKKSPKTYGSFGGNEIDNAIVNFQACKESATERSDCRNSLSVFISEKYSIEDFKDKNGGYLIYDSIQPIVKRSSVWRNIGRATDQEVINKAVSYASEGGLALVIDTSQTYGHVVIVQSGDLVNSSSWGLKMPQVISLSNYKPSKSFHGKALSYAFKKSNDLQVYVRD